MKPPRSFVRRLPALLVILATTLTTTSCRQIQPRVQHVETPVPIRVVDPDRLQRTRRIAILKIENGTSQRGIEAGIRERISAAIRASGDRDVVDVSSVFGGVCEMDSVLRGEYPIRVLADMWRNYHADTVLFARISEYRPWPPLGVGITLHLVDANDARLLATINHHWTLADPDTLADYQAWLAKRFRQPGSRKIYASSPSTFFDFVAWQIAGRLR